MTIEFLELTFARIVLVSRFIIFCIFLLVITQSATLGIALCVIGDVLLGLALSLGAQ